jgi:glucose/mannose-6-phosphate isomerase
VEAHRVRARGKSPVAQVMSLVLLGDLASVYLALLRGIDPTPVDEIEGLKKRL